MVIGDGRICGQQQIPLTIPDALNIRSFGELMPIGFSSDGKWLAYTVKEQSRVRPEDSQKWATGSRLRYVVGDDVVVSDVATGEAKKITMGKGDNWLPTWSPDGGSLAFLSDRSEAGKARVWVWNRKNGELQQIGVTSFMTTQMEWTPDGKGLLITALPKGVAHASANPKKVSPKNEASREQNSPQSTVVVYRSEATDDENQITSEPWSLDDFRRDLVVLDVANGQIKSIVRDQRIATFHVSPDGRQVAFTVPKRFLKAGSQQTIYELVTVSLKTLEGRVLASDAPLLPGGPSFSWSPDSRKVAFRYGGPDEHTSDLYVAKATGESPSNVSRFGPTNTRSVHESAVPLWDLRSSALYFIHQGSLCRAQVSESKTTCVFSGPDQPISRLIAQDGNVLWTANGGRTTAVIIRDAQAKQDSIVEIDLEEGKAKTLRANGECYSCVNIDGSIVVTKSGEQLAFFREDAGHSRDLWLADPEFAHPTRFTHLNPQFEKYEFGEARLISWLSDDGEPLHGALLLPTSYREGQRYPLVVWVYGGSFLSNMFDRFGLGFDGPLNWQLLATRGYAVLLPDAPVHVGTPMRDLAKTVLPGVNRAIELGIADPARLGLMGQSFGGYSTLALMVQTGRFTAAIELGGFADLISMYGEMSPNGSAYDASVLELNAPRGLGGTPWDHRERYLENSPYLLLDRVETPLLIVHGSADSGVAPFLADQIFVGLRRLGKEVEYAKFEGEEHSPLYWSYLNQVELDDRILSWFDKHLKP